MYVLGLSIQVWCKSGKIDLFLICIYIDKYLGPSIQVWCKSGKIVISIFHLYKYFGKYVLNLSIQCIFVFCPLYKYIDITILLVWFCIKYTDVRLEKHFRP